MRVLKVRNRVRSVRELVVGFLVALSIFCSCRAHPTPDMEGVQRALCAWVQGLLNGDVEMIASVLDDDMTTSDGLDRPTYLKMIGGKIAEIPVTQVIDKYAYHEQTESGIRVGPIVVFQANDLLITPTKLTFRKRDGGWKIFSIVTGVEAPPEVLAVDLPEQYQRYQIEIRLQDAAAGQPTAGRVHVRDSSGRYWPPDGHQKNVPIGWREDVGGDVVIDGKTYAYVRSPFRISLPQGDYEMEVLKGIEYEPACLSFSVQAEVLPAPRVDVHRWSEVSREGWYSGDTHVHFLDTTAALLEAEAEDLHVVNILATRWGQLITDVQQFTGAPDPVSRPDHIIYVNEESRHAFLGHTVLLNLKELVYPLGWGNVGDEGVPGGLDYPPMAIQADKTHAQGGFVSWAHFPSPKGEVAIDIALGKVDSVDLMTWGNAFRRDDDRAPAAETWYRFLNCGFRIPATGGTDKMWNNQVLGIPRTYVGVEGDLTYESWLKGIRAGRTFVTTGPLIFLEAGGKGLGETIQSEGASEIPVRAEVRSRLPVEKLEIVQGGDVVAFRDNLKGQKQLVLEASVPVKESSWIAARAYSSEILPYQVSWYVYREGIPLMAHTSPVYVEIGEQPTQSAEDAAHFITWIDESLEWVRTKARIPERAQREEMIHLFQEAKKIYQRQLN